jgi:opacity protein-like surface antigen
MKKYLLFMCVVAGLLFALVSQGFGAPTGSSRTRDYLVGVQDIGRWSAGLSFDSRKRDADANGFPVTMKTSKVMGYLGYDVLSWVTAYATAGSTEYEFSDVSSGGGEAEYGGGVRLNLLDHDVLEPTILEDKIQIHGTCQFTRTKAEYLFSSSDVDELYASLILSVVNETTGNKYYVPHSIALFVGAVYADLDASNFDEDGALGYTAGLEIFYTENLSFSLGIQGFDQAGFVGGVHLTF